VLLPLRVRLGHLSCNNSGGSATEALAVRRGSHRRTLTWCSQANYLRWSLPSPYSLRRRGESTTAWHNRGERRSPRRWQGGHSASTSSLCKIFSLATAIRTLGRTNHSADEDRGTNSPAVRYAEPDLVQSLYHCNHSLERLTEQLAMLCSQIFMWQLPNLSMTKLISYIPAWVLL
jgi:hypothetical protein